MFLSCFITSIFVAFLVSRCHSEQQKYTDAHISECKGSDALNELSGTDGDGFLHNAKSLNETTCVDTETGNGEQYNIFNFTQYDILSHIRFSFHDVYPSINLCYLNFILLN